MRDAHRTRMVVLVAMTALCTVLTGAYMEGAAFLNPRPPPVGPWPSELTGSELRAFNSSDLASALRDKPRHRLCAMSRSFNHDALLAQWVCCARLVQN